MRSGRRGGMPASSPPGVGTGRGAWVDTPAGARWLPQSELSAGYKPPAARRLADVRAAMSRRSAPGTSASATGSLAGQLLR